MEVVEEIGVFLVGHPVEGIVPSSAMRRHSETDFLGRRRELVWERENGFFAYRGEECREDPVAGENDFGGAGPV